MKKLVCSILISLLVSPVWAQGPIAQSAAAAAKAETKYNTHQPVSRGTGITGVVITLVGVGLLIPDGDTYHILGDSYCVSTYRVDYGGCGPGVTEAQLGLILIGSGVFIAWLGLRDKWVTVAPTVTPTGGIGTVASIRW